MRRFFLLVAALAASTFAMAQSVIIVDSEKIFKSLDSYNSALAEVEKLSKDYQAQVDAKFNEVEQTYNNYVARKAEYSLQVRQSLESQILSMEKAATEFQQQHFSKDGTIMKRRLELIAPIQERVFSTIEKYADEHGADVVIDESSNPSLLYGAAKANHTQGVIDALKQQ